MNGAHSVGTGGSFPELKRLGREADHSPNTSLWCGA